MDDPENNQDSYEDLLKRLSRGIKKIDTEDIGGMSEEQKKNFQYVQKRLEEGGRGEREK